MGAVSTASGTPTPSGVASDAGAGEVSAFVSEAQAVVFTVGALGLVWVVGFSGLCRRGGLDRRGSREVSALPALAWFFVAVTVFYVQFFAGALVSGVFDIGAIEETLGGVKVSSVVGGGAALVTSLVAVGFLVVLHKAAPRAGMSWRWKEAGVGALSMALVFPIVASVGALAAVIAAMLGAASGSTIAHDTLEVIASGRDNPWAWGLVFAVVVGVPIVEEVIYRVGVQSAVRRLTGSAWASVLLTSALFSAMHWSIIPAGSRHQLAALFALSVAMGAVFEWRRSIAASIAMHGVFNLVNVALAVAG